LSFNHLDCFKYCFEHTDDQQEFWNIYMNLTKFIAQFKLDDPVWSKLAQLDLHNHPDLELKILHEKRRLRADLRDRKSYEAVLQQQTVVN